MINSVDYVSMSVVLTALIAAIGTAIVNIIIAWRTNTVVAGVASTAKTIEAHVNSAATASTAKIDALEKQILALTAAMADQKQIAALLAQTVSKEGV
jgi:hypothetical protein